MVQPIGFGHLIGRRAELPQGPSAVKGLHAMVGESATSCSCGESIALWLCERVQQRLLAKRRHPPARIGKGHAHYAPNAEVDGGGR